MERLTGIPHDLQPLSRRVTAAAMCVDVPTVAPGQDNGTVLSYFTEHPAVISLPVVENGLPVGLINRHVFLSQMSRLYFRELYEHKSCVVFMNDAPLVIDSACTLDAVAHRMVAFSAQSVTDGFIITHNGYYLGMGLGIDVIKMVSELQTEQHDNMMQSIAYARVIQESLLSPSREILASQLQDWALTWQPKDCVGGDYYAFRRVNDNWLLLIADCTGHGVPGAFMTLILSAAFEKASQIVSADRPDQLLSEINLGIKYALSQSHGTTGALLSNDGCDAIALFIDKSQQRLIWSAARSNAFLIASDAKETLTLQSDRMGIGYRETPADYCWPRHEVRFASGDLLFLFTDGLSDQVGEQRPIMFGRKRIRHLLEQYRDCSAREIDKKVMQHYLDWQGNQVRRDDLTFLTLRY
ncbi:MAG: Phosphoserine phosphatase RsbU [Candidatus Erwinia impunctatus]|nr:Phosphoserine phosphatase RsbU [Culicoides impunctatus]